MKISVFAGDSEPGLDQYVQEIFRSWGLPLCESSDFQGASGLDPHSSPVAIALPGVDGSLAELLLDYVNRGGSLVSFLPADILAGAAGLKFTGEKQTPLRLRLPREPVAGLAGELLPVVGNAGNYEVIGESVQAYGYLSFPGQFHGETIGVAETAVGRGRIVAIAFDLPLSVLLCRQGDPAYAEQVPEGDGCARPSHLAADIGPNDAAWIPYADLLSRWLVDLVVRLSGAPVPRLYHLPGESRGILVYSGDEDHAEVACNEDQFGWMAQNDARMNLYIIPESTHSTRADGERYRQHHDLGPHPNLRPLDGEPVSIRISDLERQILLFEEMYGIKSRSIRNHSTAWAGYMEPVEVMEKLGIGMDGNYFSGTYRRDRESAPYAGFGGAIPMRYSQPNGRMLNVYQQHTHVADDVLFGRANYSYMFSLQQWEVILDRIFTDIETRFHVPYAVCIHPGNWVRFSGDQGRALVREAQARRFPVWSFDQWLDFWEARDSYSFSRLSWDGTRVTCELNSEKTHSELRMLLPLETNGMKLKEVFISDQKVDWTQTSLYRRQHALVELAGADNEKLDATYE